MTERPILFSGPMVQAILAGRKTQTRRLAKCDGNPFHSASGAWVAMNSKKGEITEMRPYAEVGDTLWVRETWAHYQTVNHIRRPHGAAFSEVSDGLAGYRADGFDSIEDFRNHVAAMSDASIEAVEINGNRWRPSIYMPRWASRITLKVTDVRLEPLVEISADDAEAEGWPGPDESNSIRSAYPIGWYAHLWDQINGKRAPWDSNPWVWVLTFCGCMTRSDNGIP